VIENLFYASKNVYNFRDFDDLKKMCASVNIQTTRFSEENIILHCTYIMLQSIKKYANIK